MNEKQIGTVILSAALILALIWFGWKLPVVLFLALWGNNIEQFRNR